PLSVQGMHLTVAAMHGSGSKDVVVDGQIAGSTGLVVITWNGASFSADPVSAPTELVIVTGDGSGNLTGTLLTQPLSGAQPFGIVATDINKDGRVDVVTCDSSNLVSFVQNVQWP